LESLVPRVFKIGLVLSGFPTKNNFSAEPNTDFCSRLEDWFVVRLPLVRRTVSGLMVINRYNKQLIRSAKNELF